jgi:hypothetical protein
MDPDEHCMPHCGAGILFAHGVPGQARLFIFGAFVRKVRIGL